MKFNPRRLARVAKCSFPFALAVSAALFTTLFAAEAWADTPANKQDAAGAVTVDFSVLGDGVPGSLGAPLPGSGGRRLLMPGVKSPRSQLHVSPVGASRRARPPRTASSPKVAAVSPPAKAAPAPPAMPVPKVEAAPPPPPPTQTTADKPPASLAIVPERKGEATAAIETPAPEPEKSQPEKTQPDKTMASEPPAPPPALTPPESPPESPKEPPKEPETAAASPPEKAPEPAPSPPAAPPAPTSEPAADTGKPAEPAPAEKAALTPPAMALEPGRAMRVEFAAAQSKVPADVKPRLEELAAGLKDRPGLRVQILAYAGGDDLSAGKARRLSLSRALSVRSFLIEKEIRSTRIDVRALGNKTTEKPLNRVDINITER